jgi:transportin-1
MEPSVLQTVIQILASASSPSNEVQQNVIRALEDMSLRSDFGTTLSYILANPGVAPVTIRQSAGLLLKSLIVRGTVSTSCSGLRDAALRSLGDPEPVIRRTCASVLTAIVTMSPRSRCSDVLAVLTHALFDTIPDVAQGAYDALLMICEDVVDMWRKKAAADSARAVVPEATMVDDFLTYADEEMIPRIFNLNDQLKKMQLLNKFALNFLFFPNCRLQKHLGPYFHTLGQLAASESNPEVVSLVCKGLVYIAQHHPDIYADLSEGVIRFMLKSSGNGDYSVRLEALRLWPIVVTNAEWISTLQPYLHELMPLLIDNMVYTEEDYLNMEDGLLCEDDSGVPDRPEDIAPRFHKDSKTLLGESDDVEEDEDSHTTWGHEWTVRKAAASALDHIATAYRDSILPDLLPLIESKLRSEDWEFQESALLALGAIGHGCMQGLSPHLPSIIRLLEEISRSRKPLLRSISCWTISRFSSWISFDTHRPDALPLALSVILSRMVDKNKRVQEAAVSAFVSLQEEVGVHLGEHLTEVVQTVCKALVYYQSKNLLILLDAIAGLFETLEPDVISRPEVIQSLVIPLVDAFSRSSPITEKQLTISLFECLTSVSAAVGGSMGQTNLCLIVSRCMLVIGVNSDACDRITVSQSGEEKPDGDVLACALDLLCGVLDGLGNRAIHLTSSLNFAPHVCRLVSQFDWEPRPPTLHDFFSNTVKQCTFALLGDIAKTCPELLTDDLLSPIFPILVSHITKGPALVSNNSSWAIGEICMRKSPPFVAPFFDNVAAALLTNLNRLELGNRSIVQRNAAIALGRLAIVGCGRLISSGCFNRMFDVWCKIVKEMRTDVEKLTAVKGFTMCIEASPECVMSPEKLVGLFELIASLFPLPETLEKTLMGIVKMYREKLGSYDWDKLWSALPIDAQYRLNQAYGLNMPITSSRGSSQLT